ncbi:hypothetical protein T484DRAFT_1851872 [Baffinella frigidus]|nr:hypothetical protein T484DRAFT_1851872 [Cryptophyta sp. CCMP2293]
MSSISTPSNATSSSIMRRTPKPAGVGIYFQDDGANIVVNHLIRGGSAERSGDIKAGDVIVSIDSRDVRCALWIQGGVTPF